MGEAIITDNTRFTLGVLIILLGAAVSWGIMYQKVNNLEEKTARIEDKLDLVLTQRAITSIQQ